MNFLPKVRRTHFQTLPQRDLLSFADNIVKTSSKAKQYKVAKAEIAHLKECVKLFKKSLADLKFSNKKASAHKDEMKTNVKLALGTMADVIDAHADGSVEYVQGSGFEAKFDHLKSRARRPNPPNFLRVKPAEDEGKIRVYFDLDPNDKVLKTAAETSVDEGASWQNGQRFGGRRGAIKDLPSGKEVWVRLVAIGVVERSEPSQILKVVVP